MIPRHPVKTIEVALALIVLAHGVLWASPVYTFPLSANYKVMASILPEDVWAAMFLVLGVGWMAAVISKRIIPRRLGVTVGGGALLWMGATFWLSNPNTIIGWVILILGVASFVTSFELR